MIEIRGLLLAISRGGGSGTPKHEHGRRRKTIGSVVVNGWEDHGVQKKGLHTKDIDDDELSIWFGEVQTLYGTSGKLLIRVLSKN